MCGICGKAFYERQRRVEHELIQKMTDAIVHRGPDGEGKYISGPVGLGHRRLAIIDLSTGDQPMCNEDKTVWIVFNGEIYNYQELREDLIAKGHAFSSNTDTEVIVHSYEEYGVDCLSRLQGMFAFALWDEKQQSLFIARDRVGIKPLYYCDTGDSVVFGSEIKSILMDPAVKREVNPAAIDCFLSYLYSPGSETLFKGISKLEPGFYLLIKDGRCVCRQYWDLKFNESREWSSLDEAADALWDLLKKTVRGHMISDVPVGFLLSGGVDSTALLSCAVGETDKKISTFTLGFAGADFADERPYARMAADRFGTDHYEMTISAQEFRDFFPKYVWHMEEPVCEPPAVALYYVSKLASQHVKVVLSGEGGDEAFGGYQNYRNMLLLEKGKRAAGPFNGFLAGLLRTAARVDAFHRAQKYAPMMTTPLSDYYQSRVSSPFSYFNRNKETLYTPEFSSSLGAKSPRELTNGLFHRVKGESLLNQMLYVDTKTWLPDDLLIKADKITMANSLELRVPLLDHLVLEFAARLSPEYKVKGFSTKRVLKKAFADRVPLAILKRKKTGFPVPYSLWFKGPLRGYIRDVLLSREALSRCYFRKNAIEHILTQFDQGSPLAKEVFSLVTLELWHTQLMDKMCSNAA